MDRKIGHDVYYPVPLHCQVCFQKLAEETGSLPETEQAAKETIALPVYPEMNSEQQHHVVETIVEFVRANVTVGAS